MFEALTKDVWKIGMGASAILSVVLAASGRTPWAGGVMIGALWMAVSLYLLVQILAITAGAGRKDRLAVLAMLKFPVMYLTGFLILKSRFFPVVSIVAGLTLVLAVFAYAWLRHFAGRQAV